MKKKLLSLMLLATLLLSGAMAQGDGELRVRARSGVDIDTMDPAFYRGNEEYNVDMAIYAKLVRFLPDSAEIELDAAEHFELSDDGLRADFRLREGIQFHHGYGEMTAEDVKFSFERMIDPDLNSPYASDWATLESVEVTGRYEGTLHFSAPYAPLLSSTLPWAPGSILSKAAFEDLGDRFALNPVGAGPYYWSEWQPNQQLVLERFADYYGELPDFARIVIVPVIDPQIAEFSFDAGELDATEVSLDSIPRYEADPDVTVEILPALRYHWLGFNMESEPFDDIRVREAIRLAVDVEEVLLGAYSGVPERARSMIPEGILGHWEDAPAYEPDLERARELLAEAGYPDGFSSIITTDDVPQHLQSAAIIQQQLNRVGITTDITIVSNIYDSASAGDPGMHYASFSGVLDPGYWFEWFTCDQRGSWNYWQWCNEEFDELKEAASLITDPDARHDMYMRMQQLIDEDIAAIWTTNGSNVYAYRTGQLDPAFLAMYAQYVYWQDLSE